VKVPIVRTPTHKRLYYQGFTSDLSDNDIVAHFTARFGSAPKEIVRSGNAGSIVLAGPVAAGNGRHSEKERRHER
jgi:hypothetical protein